MPIPRPSIAWLVATVLGVLAGGCSPTRARVRKAEPTALDREDDLQRWELLTRTDLVFMLTTVMGPESSSRPCPAVTPSQSDPALTLFTGDCTDDAGQAWHGQAERWHWASDGGAILHTRMREYGSDDLSITGSTWFRNDSRDRTHFFLDVELENPELLGDPGWLALRHRGHEDATGWHGRGHAAVDGWGHVATRTEGLVFDKDVCPTEPIAGKTTLSAGRHEVELEFDGATDCDRPGTARWRYDGQPRGEVSGVSAEMGCTPGDDEGAPPAGAWLVLLGIVSPRLRRPRAARR